MGGVRARVTGGRGMEKKVLVESPQALDLLGVGNEGTGDTSVTH